MWDCAGIPWLLRQAKYRPKEFNHHAANELEQAIADAEDICAAKAKVLAAIKHRRDRWLAHLDKRTIHDPDQFAKDAQLTYPELEKLFACAAEILNTMADLCGQAGFLPKSSDSFDCCLVLA
jgi:hypothetical protein